ncbi:Repeat domain-containing protein [Cellulomonas sp. KH9]|nr:Repeat domain-containing protein [Cellulomonas sp. KH9]
MAPSSPTLLPVDCVERAPDAAAAAVAAVACDREVEVLDARSEWATTFALPDGSMRVDTSIAAVRTDVSGEWAPVDPSVVEGDGGLVVASAVTPMTFSDGSDGAPLARIERDGHEVVFDAPFDLPVPGVEGSQVTYAQVLPGVDLVVTVNEDATGFSEVLRVESPEAAAHPALAELTFDVETSEGIELEAADGGFVAADDSGEPVFTSPVPTMWDAGPASSATSPWLQGPDLVGGVAPDSVDPAVAPADGADVVAMQAEVGEDAVVVTPDADLLTDPTTRWPVFIDPGVSGSLNQRMGLRTSFGNRYNFTGDEGVGVCDVRVIADCDATYRARILWQFAGLQGVGNLEPSDVQSAVFAVTGTHSYSCTPMPVTLHAVADFDAGTVYPGGGYWKALQTQTITHRSGCGAGKEPRRIEFDATQQARDVAAANTGVASFGMAADEGAMASWKRYAWDASFSVTYNRPPARPSNVRVTAPDAGCVVGGSRPAIRSTTPTLRAVISDPDGGNAAADFAVVSAVNTNVVVWDPGALPAQGSGAEHALQIPSGKLQDGGQYRWLVLGVDPSGAASATVACEFTVDLTPPPGPQVAAIAGQAAVYAEDAWAGGIGQPGLFRFSTPGSADVTSYRYSFNSSALDRSAPADAAVATFTPSTVGSQTLRVKAVDRAGNTGPERLYRFTVQFAPAGDMWRLDETSGTTAADAAPGAPRPLTLSNVQLGVDGPGIVTGKLAGDRAALFGADTARAATAGPVLQSDGAYTVVAHVRLDDTSASRTAVSQDGTVVSGFELGHRVDADCPTTSGSCWAFTVPDADAAGGDQVVVRSSQEVEKGEWVQLIGSRSATGALALHVCSISANPLASTAPVTADGQTATSWSSGGAFRVGGGLAAGSVTRPWRGAVGRVLTYTDVLSTLKVRTACGNPYTEPTSFDPAPPRPAARNAAGIDLDGSGTADAFWIDPSAYWRTSFGGAAPWATIGNAGVTDMSWFHFADMDGDGKDDVVLTHPDGRFLVSHSGVTGWERYGGDSSPRGNVKIGDLDGDGKGDIFWSNSADGNWRVSYEGRRAWKVVNNAGAFGTESFQLADMNGDGADDVFLVHDGRYLVSHNGTSAWQVYGTGGSASGPGVKLGDLDGDGKADIFWASGDGTWRMSSGGRAGWKVLRTGVTGVTTQQLQLADFDGDGKDDVFHARSDGRWLVSYGGTSAWVTLATRSEAGSQVRVR